MKLKELKTSIECKTLESTFNERKNTNAEWYGEYFGLDYWDLVEFSCSTVEVTEGELQFLKKYLNEHKSEKILDLCSGIGRHSIPLAEEGYDVTSIEINKFAVDYARKNSNNTKNNLTLIHDDVRKINYQEAFDLALLMQTSFGYFTDEENELFLKQINDSLKENGLLIIDIPNRDGMIKHFSFRDWTSVGEKYYCISHQFDYLKSRRNTSMKVIDCDNNETRDFEHSIRMYSLAEMKTILERQGFTLVHYFGDFHDEGIRYSHNHRRLQLVAQKVSKE